MDSDEYQELKNRLEGNSMLWHIGGYLLAIPAAIVAAVAVSDQGPENLNDIAAALYRSAIGSDLFGAIYDAALSAASVYETTYAIPSDSAWIGRKVAVSYTTKISGVDVSDSREVEIVGSPAQVFINSITDNVLPAVSANIKITNEGTAQFEYAYEYCLVRSNENQCGGGGDLA